MQELIYFFENISSLQRSFILVGGITFFWSIESIIPLFKFDYSKLKSLSYEAKEKLTAIKPVTVSQASRISGVSPNDISVMLVYMGR